MDEGDNSEANDYTFSDHFTTSGQQTESPVFFFASYTQPGILGVPEIDSKARAEPSLFETHNVELGSRIVIVQDATDKRQHYWTFVPRPKGTGQDPSQWPQAVIVHGVTTHITQHVWDFYKCDPTVDCYAYDPPLLPVVSRRSQPQSASNLRRSETPFPAPKRRGSEEEVDDASPSKRRKTYVEDATDSSNSSESDSDIAETGQRHYSTHEHMRSKLKREKVRKERAQPRNTSFRMFNLANDLPNFSGTSPQKPAKEKISMETDPTQTKRSHYQQEYEPYQKVKRRRVYQDGFSTEEIEDTHLRPDPKKGPGGSRPHRTLPRRRQGVEQREKDFWEGVDFSQLQGVHFSLNDQDTAGPEDPTSVKKETHFPSVSPSPPRGTRETEPILIDSDEDNDDDDENDYQEAGPSRQPGNDRRSSRTQGTRFSTEEISEGEIERMRRIAESKRKLEEINYRERMMKEEQRQREESYRRKQEQRRREQERLQREMEERLRKVREATQEDMRRARAEAGRRSDGWPKFTQTNAPWTDARTTSDGGHYRGINFEWFQNFADYRANGYRAGATSSRTSMPGTSARASTSAWTAQKALDRYNALSASFDSFKSTPEIPVPPLDQIPWPVLFPAPFGLDKIDWEAVEKFFQQAETLMGGKTYGRDRWKEFLKTSTRRFHPDRWRARGIIGDKGYGPDVEDKVNHISKVLTPLYRGLN